MNPLPEQPDPHHVLLDKTVAALRSIGPADRRWLFEVLLDELGIVYGISDHTDPLMAIREVGDGLPAALVAGVHRHPERRAELVAAARQVVARIGIEVEVVAAETC